MMSSLNAWTAVVILAEVAAIILLVRTHHFAIPLCSFQPE